MRRVDLFYGGVLLRLFNGLTCFACAVGAEHPPSQTSSWIPLAAPRREGQSGALPSASLGALLHLTSSRALRLPLLTHAGLPRGEDDATVLLWVTKADANTRGGASEGCDGGRWHSLRVDAG